MRNSAHILLFATIGMTIGCVSGFGQAKGGGTSAGTGTGTGTVPTPAPTPIPAPTRSTTPTTPIPQMQRPIFISGRVTLEDGTQPPASATILRVCNGVARAMGYSDSKGRFNFDLNHSESTFQDASIASSGNITGDPSRSSSVNSDLFGGLGRSGISNSSTGEVNLVGCELRAQLGGYRSSSIDLAMRRSMDDPEVGTIILHRVGKDEGSTVSMTSMMAPKDAKKAYEKGMDALKKKKLEDAERDFQKAVTSYPKFADAWFRLGMLQVARQDVEGAKSSFAQSMTADPKLVTPYVEMTIILARENKWKETADTAGKAIRLDPIDFPVAYYFDALANYNLQNWDAAEKSARQLQKIDTRHHYVMINRILGAVLAEKKDYPGAAQQMRNYLEFAGGAKDVEEVRGQLQQLEKMSSGTAPQAPDETAPKQ